MQITINVNSHRIIDIPLGITGDIIKRLNTPDGSIHVIEIDANERSFIYRNLLKYNNITTITDDISVDATPQDALIAAHEAYLNSMSSLEDDDKEKLRQLHEQELLDEQEVKQWEDNSLVLRTDEDWDDFQDEMDEMFSEELRADLEFEAKMEEERKQYADDEYQKWLADKIERELENEDE
jgi:hypothetical protein